MIEWAVGFVSRTVLEVVISRYSTLHFVFYQVRGIRVDVQYHITGVIAKFHVGIGGNIIK